MMDKEEFIRSQKECADMLGMSLNEYQDYCNNKNNLEQKENIIVDGKYDNDILEGLGLTPEDLKVREG